MTDLKEMELIQFMNIAPAEKAVPVWAWAIAFCTFWIASSKFVSNVAVVPSSIAGWPD